MAVPLLASRLEVYGSILSSRGVHPIISAVNECIRCLFSRRKGSEGKVLSYALIQPLPCKKWKCIPLVLGFLSLQSYLWSLPYNCSWVINYLCYFCVSFNCLKVSYYFLQISPAGRPSGVNPLAPSHFLAPSSVRQRCSECDQTFSSTANLSRHVKVVHQRQYPLACNLCGKGLATRQRLRGHLIHKHGIDFNRIL